MRCIQSQIWQYCGKNVGILGTQSPKYVRVKGLQTGPFKSLLLDYSILLKPRHDELIHESITLHNHELILR